MTSIPSSFNVSSTAGPLGAYLQPSTDPAAGSYNVLASAPTSKGAATALALGSGGLKKAQQNVIQVLGDSGKVTTVPWNKDNTEPSVLANIRGYGWIKLVGKTFTGPFRKPAGEYELTTLGKAIYKRTGGGSFDTPAAVAAATAGFADTTSGTASSAATSVASTAAGISVLA